MAKDRGNLEVKRFVSRSGQNQYLLISGDEATTIDVSEAIDEVGQILEDRNLTLKYMLVTHAHPSHVQALPLLKQKFGATFCLHEYEYQHLKETDVDTEPDRILNDNDTLKLGTVDIRVLLTAGHTNGSVCFWIKDAAALFSGSTLLKKSYGRIWGPSSMSLMHFSLKRLGSTIPSETTIYTGSGALTKMANEGWIHCMRSA
ncbi:MAG: MBL fold metallo-hydrolase [Deltaproteobacteria bacterium]|jgi:glyoxylase-like metal-dependent hydrolase (beta-lactamase superfamily II)|nr:MBL fold metallo-hydrolase [Deltaproteobacteria bacterium]